MTSTNITSYLVGNTKPATGTTASTGFTLPSLFSSASSAKNASSASFYNRSSGNSPYVTTNSVVGSISRIAAYVGAILVVALILLVFIHFFITPIFRFHPGTPGIIPIPGFEDGKLFWGDGGAGKILNTDLPIESQCHTYSLIMDIFLQNPLQFSRFPRILFSRGASDRLNPPTGATILGVVKNYNLIIALQPDTTDLMVSVLNKDNNPETVIINNIPIQNPFRLGMVVMENALEVYMNGKLVKTRTFDATPKSVVGDIMIADGTEINVAKIRNLKIWGRILTSSELRYATPSLSSASSFGAGPIPATTSCPS